MRTFVVGNSSDVVDRIDRHFMSALPNIRWAREGPAVGLSAAQNEILRTASRDGYKWVILLDQDGAISESQYNQYVDWAGSQAGDNLTVIGVPDQAPVRRLGATSDDNSVPLAMAHGCIFRAKALLDLGGFKEEFFVDYIDHEVCLRVAAAGRRIERIENIWLPHEAGESRVVKSLRTGEPGRVLLHRPWRFYYMVRDFLRMALIYRAFKREVSSAGLGLLKRLKGNLIYSPERLSVAWYALKGLFAFVAGTKGRAKGIP